MLAKAAFYLWIAVFKLKTTTVQKLFDSVTNRANNVARKHPEPTPQFLRQMKWAIAAIAQRFPGNPQCLPQAVAAACWLSNLGVPHSFHLGVQSEGNSMIVGHAWVSVEGLDITPAGNEDVITRIYSSNEDSGDVQWR